MYFSTEYFHSEATKSPPTPAEQPLWPQQRQDKVKGALREQAAQDLSPFIRANNRFQERVFGGATGGMDCFSFTAASYIQTNERAGGKIMRDGMGEK